MNDNMSTLIESLKYNIEEKQKLMDTLNRDNFKMACYLFDLLGESNENVPADIQELIRRYAPPYQVGE